MNESTSQNPENRPRKIYVLDRTRVFTPRERIKKTQEPSRAEVVSSDNGNGRAGGWPRQGPPPAGLTCLNGDNYIENLPSKLESPTRGPAVGEDVQRFQPQVKKRERQLFEWVAYCAKTWGENRMGMLTISTRENIEDHKEYSRRFRSFSNALSKVVVGWVRVDERQKRGAWHSHLVIVTHEDIRTGTDVQQLNQLIKDYRDKVVSKGLFYRGIDQLASEALRELWRTLRELCGLGEFKDKRETGRHYKFDNCHLMPVVKTGPAMAWYVAGYASKNLSNRRPEDKHRRLMGATKNISRACSQSFGWATGRAWLNRQKLKLLASMSNVKDEDGFREMLGDKWAYRLRPVLNHMSLEQYPSLELAEMDGWGVRNRDGELWPGTTFEPPRDEVIRSQSEAFGMLMQAKKRMQVRRSDRIKPKPTDEPEFPCWIELSCGPDA